MSREGSHSWGSSVQVMYLFASLCPAVPLLQNMIEKILLPARIVMNELLVLEILQHADFCSGETEQLCKAAAVKAGICAALVPAKEGRVWSRGRWSRPHRAPPAASPEQTEQQFLEDSLASSFFVCTEHLLQERWAEQCQIHPSMSRKP